MRGQIPLPGVLSPKCVVFDLHRSLCPAVDRGSVRLLYERIWSTVLGTRVSGRRALAVTRKIRSTPVFDGRPSNLAYWIDVNVAVAIRLGQVISTDQALAIHEMFISPELYSFPRPHRALLRTAVNVFGANVWVATSSDTGHAMRLLVRHGIVDMIPHGHLLTPDVISGHPYKPDPAFFVGVAQHIGCPPEHILAVLDSPWNDLGAAQVGMYSLFLINERGLHKVLHARATSLLTPDAMDRINVVRSAEEAREWVEEHVRINDAKGREDGEVNPEPGRARVRRVA